MSLNNLLLVFETVWGLKQKFAKKLIMIKEIRLICFLKEKTVCRFRKLVYNDETTGTCEIDLLTVFS